MKIIVFGGTGWLGHNVVLQLLEAGYDVTICSHSPCRLVTSCSWMKSPR